MGVGFEIYRGLSRSIENWTQHIDSKGECLSRSIETYRRDALQSDGKSDGKSVTLGSRLRFTVRSIFELTVNLECEVEHQCGSSGDRRVGLADANARSPRREGTRVRRSSWLRAQQRSERAGDETTCASLIYGTTSSTATLSERRSIRGDRRRQPALATFHSRVVRSPRSLGIKCPQCLGQRSHV